MSNKRPKVNFGAPKKVDKTEEPQYNIENTDNKEPNFTKKAYLPVYNEKRKAYDMLVINVDTELLLTEITVEEMRFDSEMRAMMELTKRYTDDFIKKGKK